MKSDPCSTPTQHPRHTGPDHQPTLRVKAPRPVSKPVTPATRPAPPVSSVSKPAPPLRLAEEGALRLAVVAGVRPAPRLGAGTRPAGPHEALSSPARL